MASIPTKRCRTYFIPTTMAVTCKKYGYYSFNSKVVSIAALYDKVILYLVTRLLFLYGRFDCTSVLLWATLYMVMYY